MTELGVNQVFARSPQAKGRVERLAGTFQDRLVTEVRHAAAAIAEAQAMLERFLSRFNARFQVEAAQLDPAYHALAPALDLGAIVAFDSLSRSLGTTPSNAAGARSSSCPARSGPSMRDQGSK